MHGVPLCDLFEPERDAQGRRFIVQTAGEHDRLRQMLERTVVRGGYVEESARHADRWMAS